MLNVYTDGQIKVDNVTIGKIVRHDGGKKLLYALDDNGDKAGKPIEVQHYYHNHDVLLGLLSVLRKQKSLRS